LMEEVSSGGVNNFRHYVYAGSEPVAVYSRTSTSVNTWSYFQTDHQGGVADITNSSGAKDVSESFTAYGNRRSASTWSGAETNTNLTTIAGLSRQGYTFQTALGLWMGLNHMNGRVQDAITGRFLSPDPTIPDPTDTQSFNRYSYARNNPLSLIDPSGFTDKDSSGGGSDTGGTFTGSNIPGVNGFGEASCSGNCAAFNLAYNSMPGAPYTGPDPHGGAPYVNGQQQQQPSGAAGAQIDGNGSAVPTSSGAGGCTVNSVVCIGSPANLAATADGSGSASDCAEGCLSEIDVDGTRTITPNSNFLPPQAQGAFPCGTPTCSYQMGLFNYFSGGGHGVWILVNMEGQNLNGQWVQTFISGNNTGNLAGFVTDWLYSSGAQPPFYSPSYSGSDYFFDNPGRANGQFPVVWVAQATYVPSGGGSGGFTMMWGVWRKLLQFHLLHTAHGGNTLA
jgi:RHS repeat-associated protein